MKKLITRLSFLAVLFMLARTTQAGTVIDIIPKGTKVVAQVNMAKMRNTQLFQTLKEKKLRQMRIFQDAVYLKTGIDFDKVDSVWLMGVKEQEGLVVLKGQFDTARIIETVKATEANEVQTIANTMFAVLVPDKRQKDKKNLAVILDDKTIAVGNPDYVKLLVSAFSGEGETLSKDEQQLATNACSGNALMQAALLSVDQNAIQKQPMLATVKNASLTMDLLSNALSFDAKLTATSAKDADAFAKILEGLVTLYKQGPAASQTAAQAPRRKGALLFKKLVNSLKISTANDVMTMSASIPEADLSELLKSMPATPAATAPAAQ